MGMQRGKRFGVKNAVAMLLAFCMVLQSVMVDGSFAAWAAEKDVGLYVKRAMSPYFTDGPTVEEPEMGKGPVGDTDKIALSSVQLFDKNGQPLEMPDEGSIEGLSVADSIFVRYNLSVVNEEGLTGRKIQFYIPSQIGISQNISYKLASDGERFALVKISTSNLVTIELLPQVEHLSDIDAYLEMETFWRVDEIGDDDPCELRFPLGDHESVFTFKLEPVAVTADVGLKKTGEYKDGTITWRIAVTPSAKPVNVPVKNIVVSDTISPDQIFNEDSVKIYPSGAMDETSIPRASYGLFAMRMPEESMPATPSDSAKKDSNSKEPTLEMPSDTTEENGDSEELMPETPSNSTRDRTAQISSKQRFMLFSMDENEGMAASSAKERLSGMETPSNPTDNRKEEGAAAETEEKAQPQPISIEQEAEISYEEIDIQAGFGWDSAAKTWTYDFSKAFPNGIAQEYVIEFQTTPAEACLLPEHWGTDGTYKLKYRNTVSAVFPKDAIGSAEEDNQGEAAAEGLIEEPVNYISKIGGLSPEERSIWWEVTINDSNMSLRGAKLQDTLPMGVILEKNSIEFEEAGGIWSSEECSDPSCSQPGHYTYDEANRILSYYVGGTKDNPYQKTGTLRYTTAIDENWYGDLDSGGFSNHAVLLVGNWGTGGGGIPGVGITVSRNHKWIIKTAGGYDEKNGYITWNVTLNGEGLPLENVTFSDEIDSIADGQSYVKGSLKGGTESGALESLPDDEWAASGDITHEFPSLDKPYYLQFQTLVTIESSGSNKTETYENTAKIEGTYNGRPISQTGTAKQEIKSSTLKKEALGYDYIKREITWRLTVNENAMTLENAKVTDKLPKYWRLKEDSIDMKPAGNVTVTPSVDMAENIQTVEFVWPPAVSETYVFEYKTVLPEEFREPFFGINPEKGGSTNNNGAIVVENTAELSSENGAVAAAKGDQTIQNGVVKKNAVYEDGDDFITWRVMINQNKTEILPVDRDAHIKLTDDLNGTPLKLDMYSVKLYAGVSIGADGEVSDFGTVYEAGGEAGHKLTGGLSTGNIQYKDDVFIFDFSKDDLADINAEYVNSHTFVLEFSTDIITTGNSFSGDITNRIQAEGIYNGLTNDGTANGVAFTKGTGGAKGRKAVLSVKKVDAFDESILLDGARFDLYYSDFADMPFSVGNETENGVVKVEQVSFNREYTLHETDLPPGYFAGVPKESLSGYIDESPYFTWKDRISKGVPNDMLTLTVKNRPKLGWMDLKKVSNRTDSKVVNGAVIGVFKKGETNPAENTAVTVVTDLAKADGGAERAVYTTGIHGYSSGDGTIKVVGLRPGDYYFKELSAPKGYQISDEKIYFTIEAGIDDKLGRDLSISLEDATKGRVTDEAGKEITDSLATPELKEEPNGSLTIRKTDLYDSAKKLAGAEFELYKEDQSTLIKRLTTGSEGEATFEDLTAGTYYYKESKAPNHYIRHDASDTLQLVELTVNEKDEVILKDGTAFAAADGTNTIVIQNEPVGSIKIKKADAWDTSKSISGVKFVLRRDDNSAPEGAGSFAERTGTTGADGSEPGTVTFDNLPFGTYTWTEQEAPEGYIKRAEDAAKYTGTVTIDEKNFTEISAGQGKGTLVTVENTPIAGKFQIKKVDENGVPVSGAKLGIYIDDGQPYKGKSGLEQVTAVTDAEGVAAFDSLRYRAGSQYYYCQEITPPDGYALSKQKIEFRITEDGVTVGALDSPDEQIKNYHTGKQIIKKVDSRSESLVLDGHPFTIDVWGENTDADHEEYACNSTHAPETCKRSGEYHYHRTITTESGRIDLGELKAGTYYYKEISAPAGYLLDSEIHVFTVKAGVNEDIIFPNTPLGSIEITKYRTDTTKALPGAEFALYSDAECKTPLADYYFSGTAPSNSGETDEHGKIIFSSLLLDKVKAESGSAVYLKETKAPSGYQLSTGGENSSSVWKVTFEDSAAAEEHNKKLTIYNDPTSAQFWLEKVDNQTPPRAVPGAVIGLYHTDSAGAASGGTEIAKATSDAYGRVAFDKIETGHYYVKEEARPLDGHYLLNEDTAIAFTVEDETDHGKYLTIDSDGRKVIMNDMPDINAPLAAIVDIPVGKFSLHKTGEDGDRDGLAGAAISLEISVGADSWTEVGAAKKTDENGNVTFDELPFGTYRWTETEAAPEYYLDTDASKRSGTFTIDGSNFKDDSIADRNITLSNTKIRASIQVKKKSSAVTAAGDPVWLPGAVMQLYRYTPGGSDETGAPYGEPVKTEIVTGTDGAAGTFHDLPAGSYYCKEVIPPTGYKLTDQKFYFTIEDDSRVHGTVITQGKAEKEAGSLEEAVFINQPVGSFVLTKRDSTDSTKLLGGAKITLKKLNADGTAREAAVLLETGTAGDNLGTVSAGELSYGTYRWEETEAPDGYIISQPDEAGRTFTIDQPGQEVSVDLNNRPLPQYSLKITKRGEPDGRPLSGARIAVYIADNDGDDSNDTFVGEDTTDRDGIARISGLFCNWQDQPHHYYYVETKAPEGYRLDTEHHPFSLNDDGQDSVDREYAPAQPLTNELVKGTFQFTKVNRSRETLSGAQFRLEYTGRGEVIGAVENPFKDMDKNTALPYLVGNITTDTDGAVEFHDLPLGEYRCTEVKAPSGYHTPDWSYEFAMTEASAASGAALDTTLPQYANNELVNDPIYASFWTEKRDSFGQAVEGAVIGLFHDSEGADGREGTPVNGAEGQPVTAVSDRAGTVIFENIPAGRYYVQEVEVPDKAHYLLSEEKIHFEVGPDDDDVVLMVNRDGETVVWTSENAGESACITDKPVGKFTLTKTGEGGLPLNGVEITLTKEGAAKADTTWPRTGITGQNADGTFGNDGVVSFGYLEPGVYHWKETKGLPGYYWDDQPPYTGEFEIGNEPGKNDFKDDTLREVNLSNRRIQASIQVKKVDARNGKTPVNGALLALYQGAAVDTTQEPLQSVRTNQDGIAEFTNLLVGDYYCMELETPDNYVKPAGEEQTIFFRIEDDPSVENVPVTKDREGNDAEMKNEPVGSFVLTKVDSTDHSRLLPGADISLVKKEGDDWTEAGRMVTDENGTAVFENLLYGTYQWTETAPPEGYILSPVSGGTFTIEKPGQEERAVLENRPQPVYTLELKKTGEPDGRPLAGAVIRVYGRNHEFYEAVTDENGIAAFTGLRCTQQGNTGGDNYVYQEITPPKGYKLDETMYPFSLEDNGEYADDIAGRTLNLELKNSLNRGDIRFAKIDSTEEGRPLPGAEFTLTYEEQGSDGVERPWADGQKAFRAVSDADGIVSFNNLPLGRYTCTETGVPAGFHLDKEWYGSFELTKELADSDQPVPLDPEIYPTNQLINAPLYYGDFEILKNDRTTGKPLSDAVIGIYWKSTGEEVAQITTGANGVAGHTLYEGDYYYKELRAPKGYALDETIHEFRIVKNLETVHRELANEPLVKGSFRVVKTDEEGNPLAGAVIGLFASDGIYTASDELIAEKETDSQGAARFDGLEKDDQQHYYYKELKAPEGYVLDESKHFFDFTITEEGQLVSAAMTNMQQRGSFMLSKVRTNTEEPLAGAVIAVYTSEGAFTEELETGKDGIVLFEGLPLGDYYYAETKAPSGYLKDNEKHAFAITAHLQVVEEVLENTRASSGGNGNSGNSAPGGNKPVDPNAPGPGNLPEKPAEPEAPVIPGQPPMPNVPVDPEDPVTWPVFDSGEEPPRAPVQSGTAGTTVVILPDIPPRTQVAVSDTNRRTVYRGSTDDEKKVSLQLPPGDYTLLVIDDGDVPLAEYLFTIDDGSVPLDGLPKTGDRVPDLWRCMMLGILLGSASLILRKREQKEKITVNKTL